MMKEFLTVKINCIGIIRMLIKKLRNKMKYFILINALLEIQLDWRIIDYQVFIVPNTSDFITILIVPGTPYLKKKIN